MKILTWNCNGALRKKFPALSEFAADIQVIQECEDPTGINDPHYQEWTKNGLWIGDNKNKGLGIFAKQHVSLRSLKWNPRGLKHFLPCKVNDGLTLIGAWCHGANSPTFQYIGQFWKYFQLHKKKFKDCIVAGDLNSNVIWDKPRRTWNHSDVVRELKKKDIESFYHLHKNEEQGQELEPTFYLHRHTAKPYHLDYIFGSSKYHGSLKHVAVGKENWLTLSDHMPVICDIGETSSNPVQNNSPL